MNPNIIKIVQELIEAAEPFSSESIVVATTGTIPLMARLEDALRDARRMLKCQSN